MEKTMKQFIFKVVMLAAFFFMSAFLFPAGVQALEINDYDALKELLESDSVSPTMEIVITADMDITGQIEVSSKIKTLIIDGGNHTLDGGGSSAFLKAGSIDLTLQNITIENCKADDGAVTHFR